jgi:hypothetical protein
MFANRAFIDTAGVSAIFGAYFGIMLDSMYLKGTHQTVNNTSLLKSVLRLLVSVVLISPFALPMFLISNRSSMMIIYLFKTTVPFFFATLILFSIAKLVYRKFGLVHVD